MFVDEGVETCGSGHRHFGQGANQFRFIETIADQAMRGHDDEPLRGVEMNAKVGHPKRVAQKSYCLVQVRRRIGVGRHGHPDTHERRIVLVLHVRLDGDAVAIELDDESTDTFVLHDGESAIKNFVHRVGDVFECRHSVLQGGRAADDPNREALLPLARIGPVDSDVRATSPHRVFRIGSFGRHRHTCAVSSTTGKLFRVTTFGESHGVGVGCVIDGCPPRLALDTDALQADMDRRRPGQSRLVTQRQEGDRVEILSGVVDGRTLGTPIALLVRNQDQRPGAYDTMASVYRPSHADYTYDTKYGIRAPSGGGRASARETVGRVAAGAVARQLLAAAAGVEVVAWVDSVADVRAAVDPATVDRAVVDQGPTRCPDPVAATAIESLIDDARRQGDSLGGTVRCVARGVPAGWGDPVFDKLTATLGAAVLSLPAVRGIEFGSGFGSTTMRGSTHNDPFVPGPHGKPRTTTNHSGGLQGGISNGEDIDLRVAFKPTATIATPQHTVNEAGEAVVLEGKGRHDPCVLPRAAPIVEAVVLCVLADHLLRQAAVSIL